jgi:hypothetical protein
MKKVLKLSAAEVACVLKEHFGVYQDIDVMFALNPQNGAVGPSFAGADIIISESLPPSAQKEG